MVKITDDDFDDTSAIVCTGSTAQLQSREIKNLVHGAAIPSPLAYPRISYHQSLCAINIILSFTAPLIDRQTHDQTVGYRSLKLHFNRRLHKQS